MKRSTIGICVFGAILGIAGIFVLSRLLARARPDSSTPPRFEDTAEMLSIVPRDITAELSALQEISDNLRVPESMEAQKRPGYVVESARVAWAECQDLINSGKINIKYWNGRYSAVHELAGQTEGFDLSFRSGKGDVSQCTKWAVVPEAGRVGRPEYWLHFYENGKLHSFQLIASNERVEFYPSGSVKGMYIETADGKANMLTWHEDGTPDAHRRVRKADFPQFFRDANGVQMNGP